MTNGSSVRASFGSRLGFILAAAGSAVGLGAVWKFPYMVAENGGGLFLLLYLAAVLGIGLAMMLAELSLGRLARTDAVGAFRIVGGPRWSVFGYSSLLAAFCILSFYCVVGGWTVGYLVESLSGSLADKTTDFAGRFQSLAANPGWSIGYFAVFLAMTAAIIGGGVQKGIERTSKVLMPLLFLLMLAMIVRSVTLDGAWEGIRFFLIPDLSRITPGVMVEALGVACFSLSLGFGGMLTYGSYMDPASNPIRAAMWVVFLQTVCSVLAGFMVLPAVFAFGMAPAQGPGLTFITLPGVFASMPWGGLFAAIFFVLLLVAALTSSVSILEPLIAYCIDQYGLGRKAACAAVGLAAFFAGVPSALSQGGASLPLILGKTPFAFMDFLTLNILLPINVLAACLLMGWFVRQAFARDLLKGDGSRRLEAIGRTVLCICRYLAPLVIGMLLLASIG